MKTILLWTKLLLLTIIMALPLASCSRDQGYLKTAEVGQPAPDFTMLDTSGKTWTLSELRGEVIFVNFWATWCPPCREELPSMQALHNDLDGKGFQMLSILVNDDPNQAVLMAKRSNLTFPILVDSGSKAGTNYGITGVPETFIIDATGILREKIIGPKDWNSPPAREMIGQYLP